MKSWNLSVKMLKFDLALLEDALMTFEEAEKEIWLLLDQYKQAWASLHDSAAVNQLKEGLKRQVSEKYSQVPKTLEYFESQCSQIEHRWVRPQEKDHSVH